jgi:hypothetical protein
MKVLLSWLFLIQLTTRLFLLLVYFLQGLLWLHYKGFDLALLLKLWE